MGVPVAATQIAKTSDDHSPSRRVDPSKKGPRVFRLAKANRDQRQHNAVRADKKRLILGQSLLRALQHLANRRHRHQRAWH
jgi:hypothetical protein